MRLLRNKNYPAIKIHTPTARTGVLQARRRLIPLDTRGLSGFAALGILVLWLAVIGLIALNRQALMDWWQLKHYQAPATISQLVTQDTMTNYARKVFYVNHPAVQDKSAFRTSCPDNGGEQTIVLGCYHSSQAGIFLLHVTDPRLNGVQQVTAAHEMLHAAYDRLSGSERQKVDAMLQDYYDHDLQDPRLIKTIAAYKKSEPHDIVNEMHSIFGTEVANLPAPLEQYYSRYFSDRHQIVAYATQYQAEFTTRQAAVVRYDTQLGQLKSQIEATESDLKTKQSTINSQQSLLMSERNSGDVQAYNAGVPAYNALIDAYNTEVQTVRNLIDQYNQIVASRNAIAFEENQLSNALNANVNPINH